MESSSETIFKFSVTLNWSMFDVIFSGFYCSSSMIVPYAPVPMAVYLPLPSTEFMSDIIFYPPAVVPWSSSYISTRVSPESLRDFIPPLFIIAALGTTVKLLSLAYIFYAKNASYTFFVLPPPPNVISYRFELPPTGLVTLFIG